MLPTDTLYDELFAAKLAFSDDFNAISLGWERDMIMKYIRYPSPNIVFVWNEERNCFEQE